MGPVLQKVGERYNRSDIVAEGKKFVLEGAELHADILVQAEGRLSAIHHHARRPIRASHERRDLSLRPGALL